MTIQYRDIPTPAITDYTHWYAGPEGRFAITGDFLRVVRDMGDVSICDVFGGAHDVTIATRHIVDRREQENPSV